MGYFVFGAYLYVRQSKLISFGALISICLLLMSLVYFMGELSHQYVAHLLEFSGQSRWEGTAFPSLFGGLIASVTALVHFTINGEKK